MSAFDDADDRDARRHQLAKRLVAHQARTQAIYDFTGYTARRQGRLRRRWGVPSGARHRGPAPSSFAFCFETLRGRAEASTALIFGRVFGAVPRGKVKTYANLETGERLCEAYEAFRACFAPTPVAFEQFKLLAMGLWNGEILALGVCGCGAATLGDRHARGRLRCAGCRRRELNGARAALVAKRPAGES